MACITGAFTASITEEKQSAGLTLNLATVEPMVMLPCGDRNDQKKAGIASRASKAGMELNAGQIGGYTGGTIEELRKAASMLDGHKLALGFRLSICRQPAVIIFRLQRKAFLQSSLISEHRSTQQGTTAL